MFSIKFLTASRVCRRILSKVESSDCKQTELQLENWIEVRVVGAGEVALLAKLDMQAWAHV